MVSKEKVLELKLSNNYEIDFVSMSEMLDGTDSMLQGRAVMESYFGVDLPNYPTTLYIYTHHANKQHVINWLEKDYFQQEPLENSDWIPHTAEFYTIRVMTMSLTSDTQGNGQFSAISQENVCYNGMVLECLDKSTCISPRSREIVFSIGEMKHSYNIVDFYDIMLTILALGPVFKVKELALIHAVGGNIHPMRIYSVQQRIAVLLMVDELSKKFKDLLKITLSEAKRGMDMNLQGRGTLYEEDDIRIMLYSPSLIREVTAMNAAMKKEQVQKHRAIAVAKAALEPPPPPQSTLQKFTNSVVNFLTTTGDDDHTPVNGGGSEGRYIRKRTLMGRTHAHNID